MIPVAEAKKLLIEHTPAPTPRKIPLAEALGYVLAEAIHSPIEMPVFPQSAMDGYALAFSTLQEGVPLPVSHTLQAGATAWPALERGEAMRIFTGAPIPEGADTVVMQEKVKVTEAGILVLDQELQQGSNVRPKASQTAQGAQVAATGTKLSAGAIGFLSSLGIATVKVYAAPAIGILVTGKELVQAGQTLQPGQVFESNSLTLRAALQEAQLKPVLVRQVDDDERQILHAIQEGLAACNLLLITGGISVGDYDFVHGALQQAGVETIFYKVKQKPGKPLYCGRKGNTLVFGLPGNPGSVLSCFYQYVVPAIRQMKGLPPEPEEKLMRKLAIPISKKAGLTNFMKGKLRGEEVEILQGQESYKMNAFVESDCLVELPEEKSNFQQGEQLRVYPFYLSWH